MPEHEQERKEEIQEIPEEAIHVLLRESKIGTQITGAERHIVISLWKAARSSVVLLFWCLPGSRMKRNGRILHRRHRTLHQEYR